MSIVISSSYVIGETPAESGGVINADNPIIGWRNLTTTANVTTTTAAAGFPAANLANNSTNLRWQGAVVATEFVAVATNAVDPMDYIAIAKHNLASAEIAVGVQYFAGSWQQLIAPVMLSNDGPALFRFPQQARAAIRLALAPGNAVPRIAVLYTGKLLVLQRRIYVGHTPMPFGRTTKITNARSESGNFLGRIVLNQKTGTEVALQNLTPSWYRANMEPFLRRAQENPFFFAWRPASYPNEVGYAWLTNDPQPKNQLPNGMMQVSLEMEGVI